MYLITDNKIKDFDFEKASKCNDNISFVSVLCSNRVSQMTKTYNDIEAVTRLLEEVNFDLHFLKIFKKRCFVKILNCSFWFLQKEKDLELTARIGKELLSHNQKLESTVSELENELKSANEKITQLSHELLKKTELIQILTNDVDEEPPPESETLSGLKGINLDIMQRKIGTLEDENKQLKTEFAKLAHEADVCEQQEANLVKDIAAQLGD